MCVAMLQRSVKAYCYFEYDEITEGPMTLEVYSKPVDYKRKARPTLLSVKPLYCQLSLSIQQH